MNEKEKSLKLAELMGWKLTTITGDADWSIVRENILLSHDSFPVLEPYDKGAEGLAQFAAILLKFPDVIDEFVFSISDDGVEYIDRRSEQFTQPNILDEILRMNGVDV